MSPLFTILLSLSTVLVHPFHVSVCEIEFKEDTKTIQVSQRIFIDDMKVGLKKRFDIDLVLEDESTASLRDSLLQIYILENISLIIDGKEKKRRYVGNEFEEDGIWCYLEYVGVKKLAILEVKNTILLDTYDDQANIIHFSSSEYEKSIKLDKLRYEAKITVDN
jgi:hypothetical protein